MKEIKQAHWDSNDCCTNCGEEADYNWERGIHFYSNFCPNCGADMRGQCTNYKIDCTEEIKHAKWIEGAENFTCGNYNAECSNCHANIRWSGCDEDFNFCPNCGAEMENA